MAFTYKTIGNTAAAVVSLLAVGTLCWWQRTPGPLNAPRPQDEAEIMTACLERHYAMGRTGTKFTIVRPEYVSQVPDANAAGGVRYVTNSAAHTLTNTIGFFPNATFNYPQSARDALQPGTGAYGTADACKWLVPSNSYWTSGDTEWAWTDAMLTNYLHVETNWWTNWVTLSTKTTLASLNVRIHTTNIISVSTGYVVTSTSVLQDGRYAAGITSEGDTRYIAWYPNTVFQSDQLMVEIHGAGFRIPGGPGEECSSDMYFYDANAGYWVTHNCADDWQSTTDVFPFSMYPVYFSDVLDVDYGVFTNYTYVEKQVLVTNTEPYNAWTEGKKFAFERDSKPYWWSTNAYNDMSRALSTMQWQKNESAYIATRRTAVIKIYSRYTRLRNTSAFDTYGPFPFTSTFVPAGSTVDVPYSSYYASEYSVATNSTQLSPRMTCSFTDFSPSHMQYYWYGEPGYPLAWREQNEWWYVGETNWHNFTQQISIEFVSGSVGTTNKSAFVWTNGYFFFDASIITNTDTRNAIMGAFVGMTSAPSSFMPNPWRIDSGQGISSRQICDYPLTSIGGDESEWQALLSATKSVSSNIWMSCGGVYPFSGYSITNAPQSHTIPYYVLNSAPPNRCAYRVQFSALTNYLDHAPAR